MEKKFFIIKCLLLALTFGMFQDVEAQDFLNPPCFQVSNDDDCISVQTENVIHNGNEKKNRVKFSPSGLPWINCSCQDFFDENSNSNFQYSYFWRFGDDKGGFSFEREPVYTFDKAKDYTITLEVTRIKIDVDEDEKRILNHTFTHTVAPLSIGAGDWAFSLNTPYSQPTANNALVNFSRQPILTPTGGQEQYFTVVINTRKYSNIDEFFLYFCNESLELLEDGIWPPNSGINVDDINNACLDPNANALWLDLVDDPDSDPVLGQFRNFFFTFKLREGVNQGDVLPFAFDKGAGAGFETFQRTIGTSYDPNIKTVDYDYISGLTELEYTIKFRNDGCGPTQNIKVIDPLPEILDPSTLSDIEIYIGGDLGNPSEWVTLDVPDNDMVEVGFEELIFNLDGASLEGLRGLQAGTEQCDPTAPIQENFCAIQSAVGIIKYKIQTKDFVEIMPIGGQMEVPDSTIFGTSAEVYFDDNPPIVTEIAQTKVDYDNSFCSMDETIGNQIVYLNENVQVSNTITSSAIIEQRASVLYEAQSIKLTSGFKTKERGSFVGRINPCSDNESEPISNKNIFEQDDINSIEISNHPNPVTESTTISFSIANADNVSLSIVDINGREIAKILDNQWMEAGMHNLPFNAEDLASGVYLYLLETSKETQTNRMIVLED